MAERNNYDADFKMELVMEIFKGKKVSEVADEYDVSRNSLYTWKKEFIDSGLKGLTNDNQIKSQKDAELREKEKQIKEMKKIIGDQKVQMEILKKNHGWTKHFR